MAIAHEFDYAKPLTLEKALSFLDEYKDGASILAGGTDFANMMKMGFRVPKIIIDIKAIDELNRIIIENDTLHIGSLVTYTDLLNSKLIKNNFFALWEASGLVASIGVRNRATMIGNICSAVPCMDGAGPLLVHDAIIHLSSKSTKRDLPINKWFIDSRKTAINSDELVLGISIPLLKSKYGSSYTKMKRYEGEDLSQSNVTVIATSENKYKIAFGSVGPIPKRSLKIENLLNTKGVSDVVVNEAKKMIDEVIAPISDVRATKEYRFHMTKVMFERGIYKAIERIPQN